MLSFRTSIPSISLKVCQGNRRSFRLMTSTRKKSVSNQSNSSSRGKRSWLIELHPKAVIPVLVRHFKQIQARDLEGGLEELTIPLLLIKESWNARQSPQVNKKNKSLGNLQKGPKMKMLRVKFSMRRRRKRLGVVAGLHLPPKLSNNL